MATRALLILVMVPAFAVIKILIAMMETCAPTTSATPVASVSIKPLIAMTKTLARLTFV